VGDRGLRPITWAGIVVGILAAGTVLLLVLSVRGSLQHTCEVCVSFHGRTACRSASGNTAAEATKTATDNACALAGASGMTLAIECQNTPPASVTCDDGG
jgi:hypothetical protein